jgi:hypothetical protein
MTRYLAEVLARCPRGGRTLETGVGSGYGAVYLSLRDVCAEGIDNAPAIVERARQVNTVLGGSARFRLGDTFSLYSDCVSAAGDAPGGPERYAVIYHQGLLEHLTMVKIRAVLSQQAALAYSVVFSVPSVFYPFPGEFGDERLLTLEVWREILEPFDVELLTYYGDPQNGEQEHVLCVLRGQEVTDELLEMMTAHERPYPAGITGLVLARNEERNIAACLESLAFCDEVILVDMCSEDKTTEIAAGYNNARVVTHPVIHPFDRARNLGSTIASRSHVLVVDADERVPPELAEALKELVRTGTDEFEGMALPFRHHFAGRWLQFLYPGYTAPRFYKNGCFVFNSGLHSGTQVDGRITRFPADNPGKSLEHFSFESIRHYQEKQNSYTDGEAATMFRVGVMFNWRNMLLHSMQDLVGYYDNGVASKDGPYGLIYSLLSAYYRTLQHAKLFEMRANAGLLQAQEMEAPQSVGEMAAILLSALQQRPAPQAEAIVVADTPDAADVVMSGPAFDRSGYAEEFRSALFGLDEAGISIRARSLPWNDDPDILNEHERTRYEAMHARPAKPGFTHIIWDFPQGWHRHPDAGKTIVRTMHETDRFAQFWVQATHLADEIWVPTEHSMTALVDSGVEAGKIRVIAGGFDFDQEFALGQEAR